MTEAGYFVFLLEQVQKGGHITILTNEAIAVAKLRGYYTLVDMEVSFKNCATFEAIFQTNFPPESKHLIMRKNYPLLPQINRIINEETVNIRRLHRKYYKDVQSTLCRENKREPKALGKKNVVVVRKSANLMTKKRMFVIVEC